MLYIGFSITERIIELGENQRFICQSVSAFSKLLCFDFFHLLEIAPMFSKLLKTTVKNSCNKTVFFIMTVGTYADNIHRERKRYKPGLL